MDRQLAGRDLYGYLIRSGPLVFAAVGIICGILLQNFVVAPMALWIALLLTAAISAAAIFALNPANPRPIVFAAITFVCFACLGGVRQISYNHRRPNDISRIITDESKLATIRGLIVTAPHINLNPTWSFARFKPTDPTTSFYLDLTQIESTKGFTDVTGRIKVMMNEPAFDLKPGDLIQAYCRLNRFDGPTNPGQFDTARYLARRNIFVAANIESRGGIELLPRARQGAFTRFSHKLKSAAATALLIDQAPDDPAAGLLQALLLGYRSDIDSQTYEAFRRTGLLHFISLSGLHLGILIGAVWWLCKLAGLLKPARAAVCIFALALFLLVVPPRAPTLRAAIIALVFCAALLFRRRPNALNSLALAAIILLLMKPVQLFQAGWQLSFSTVLGILLFSDRINYKLHQLTGHRFIGIRRKTDPWHIHWARTIAAQNLALLAVGISAWIGGIGVMLYHFHTITPMAAIWTALLLPLVSCLLILGFAKIILFFLLPTLSTILSAVVSLLANLLILNVRLMALIDVSSMSFGHVSPPLILCIYLAIVFIAFARMHRPILKPAICAALLIAIVASLGVIKLRKTYRSDLVITCLDVSHGQSVLAQLPGKNNLLFDAGSLFRSDPAARIINPALDYLGITTLNAIVISHNDIDHLNGIPEIARRFRVERAYAGESFFEQIDRWGAPRYLQQQLDAAGVQIEQIPREVISTNACRVSVLWPTGNADQTLSDNDRSLVSLIEFAGRSVLICSDIEQFAAQKVLELYPNLHVDVIITPHHKIDTVSEPRLLEKLTPEVLICSCGRTQYDRQHDTAIPPQAKAFYTAANGAITVRISPDGTLKTTGFTRD